MVIDWIVVLFVQLKEEGSGDRERPQFRPLVEGDSETPNVHFFINRFLYGIFSGGIKLGPEFLVRLPLKTGSEVDDSELFFGVEQKVVRLEIPVSHANFMKLS